MKLQLIAIICSLLYASIGLWISLYFNLFLEIQILSFLAFIFVIVLSCINIYNISYEDQEYNYTDEDKEIY